MRVGSLFSGIGGFELGLEWAGMTLAWQVEIDPYCRKVLTRHWPHVPKYEDIRELDANGFAGIEPVDLVCGGPPCQPASLAGRRKGAQDDRWLWPQTLRAVAAVRPTWCLFENPVGFKTMGLDSVLAEMERQGYACWPIIVPACAVGALHRRDRIWILAHAPGRGRGKGDQNTRRGVEGAGEEKAGRGPVDRGEAVCDVDKQGPPKEFCSWPPEPEMDRMVHGVPGRVDRIRALGNAVVPQVVYEIGRAIQAAETNKTGL